MLPYMNSSTSIDLGDARRFVFYCTLAAKNWHCARRRGNFDTIDLSSDAANGDRFDANHNARGRFGR